MSRMLWASEINNRGKKAMETSVLPDLYAKIDEARLTSRTGQTPHNFVRNLVNETAVVCPWLTYDKLMNFHRSQLNATLSVLAAPPVPPAIVMGSPSSSSTSSTPHKHGGRKLGDNNKRKRHQQQAIVASFNEIGTSLKNKSGLQKESKSEWSEGG